MSAVYEVALVVAAVTVVAVSLIFRRRLTSLVVRFRESAFELRVAPEQSHLDAGAAAERDVTIDSSKISNSHVRLRNSRFLSRRSRIERSTFDVSQGEPEDRRDG